MSAFSPISPETQLLLDKLTRICDDAIWIWHLPTNQVHRFGEYFLKAFDPSLIGLSSIENWYNLIHPADKERVERSYQRALADPEILKTEETYRVKKIDGSYRHVLDRAYMQRQENGKADTVYGLVSDITFRKQNDMEREMLISELTKTNADLKQFVYITSHNLRTPLANLIGLGSLIDESKIEDPLIRKTLEKYKEATFQLNKNLNELFELLVQNNNPESQVKAVALDEVFKQVMDSVETKITECGAAISFNFAAGNTVNFNPGFLHSIFLNFLTNALKYRKTDRKLTIKVYTEKKGEHLLLHFSDNGLGIDLQKFGDKVFGLYQRFHDHPDSKGLGLHMVAMQVEAMGGKVWVNSQPDEGTTFTVQFN